MSFFQTADENLRYCWTASTMQASQQRSVEMERYWNLQRLKYVIPSWHQNVECQLTYWGTYQNGRYQITG